MKNWIKIGTANALRGKDKNGKDDEEIISFHDLFLSAYFKCISITSPVSIHSIITRKSIIFFFCNNHAN